MLVCTSLNIMEGKEICTVSPNLGLCMILASLRFRQGRLYVTAHPTAAGGLASTSFKISIYKKRTHVLLFSTVL
jgi:hypothetical protein